MILWGIMKPFLAFALTDKMALEGGSFYSDNTKKKLPTVCVIFDKPKNIIKTHKVLSVSLS